MTDDLRIIREDELPDGALRPIATIPVLHVFYKTGGRWHVRQWDRPEKDYGPAKFFAIANRTVVIATELEVPKAAEPMP